jgi:maltose O-acetyltransferase
MGRLGHVFSRLRYYGAMYRRSIHFRYRFANAVSGLLPMFVSGAIRGRLYRLVGFNVEKGAFIAANLKLTSAFPAFYEHLTIGPGGSIADNVTINLDAPVTIGRNVGIGPHVLIYTGGHKLGPGSARMAAPQALPVTIEDGAWIRMGAVIVPGVTVGRGAIVAAGAIVLKDVPPNTYVEGNPAQVIRKLGWGDR